MRRLYSGPRLVALDLVDACLSYREAVRACWDLRTRRSLTHRVLTDEVNDMSLPAEVDGKLYPSHVSDYLNQRPNKRDLPAKHINAFELACGNRFVSQWLARQAQLTILEQFIEHRHAA